MHKTSIICSYKKCKICSKILIFSQYILKLKTKEFARTERTVNLYLVISGVMLIVLWINAATTEMLTFDQSKFFGLEYPQ
jgi:hypothetical protein